MIGASRGKEPLPPYLATLGLREAPFAPGSDPRFYYAEPGRTLSLNMLQHLAQYSEDLLLVLGAEGAGKSTLLEQFLLRVDEHLKPCRIDGRQSDAGQLFLAVATGLGMTLAQQPPDGLIEALKRHLEPLHGRQTPVILLDDAHHLSQEALEMVLHLSQLEGAYGRLIHWVLFATPEIEARFNAPPLAALPRPYPLRLQPFGEVETGHYLNHRLAQAGLSGASPFDAKAIRRIQRESSGEPGRINAVADQLLREKVGTPAKPEAKPAGSRLWVPVVALAGAVGLMQLPYERLFSHLGLRQTEEVVASAPAAPEPAAAPADEGQKAGSVEEGPVTVSADETAPAATPSPEPVAQPEAQAPPSAAPPPAEPPREPVVETIPPPPAPAETKEAAAPACVPGAPAPAGKGAGGTGMEWLLRQPPENFTLQLLVARETSTLDEFLRRHPICDPKAAVLTLRNGEPLHLLLYGSFATKEEALAVAATLPKPIEAWPRPLAGVVPLPAPASAIAGVGDKGWVLGRDPRHWTLQVAGAEDAEALLKHLGERPTGGPWAYYTIRRDGRPWNVLLFGDFPTREAALAAVRSLPEGLSSGSPWVREFAAIHATLAEAAQPGRN